MTRVDWVYILCALVRNQSVILTLAAKLDLVQPPAGCTLGVLAERSFVVLRRSFDELHLRCSIRIFPFVYRLPKAPTMSNHAVGVLGRKTGCCLASCWLLVGGAAQRNFQALRQILFSRSRDELHLRCRARIY